jgi:hypothetical protein
MRRLVFSDFTLKGFFGIPRILILWRVLKVIFGAQTKPIKIEVFKMAVKKSLSGKSSDIIESKPKKTIQGKGSNTKCAATSRNKARKRYRGQGK